MTAITIISMIMMIIIITLMIIRIIRNNNNNNGNEIIKKIMISTWPGEVLLSYHRQKWRSTITASSNLLSVKSL